MPFRKDCTPFPCPFSVLAISLFIYCTFILIGTEARTRRKINKQGCGLARKRHGNGVNATESDCKIQFSETYRKKELFCKKNIKYTT